MGTERANETDAREHDALFRAIVDHGSELVVVTDAVGTIRFASPSSGAALGYAPDDKIGTNVVEFIHPDDVADAASALATTAGSIGVKEPIELRLQHADGSYRWFEIIATNLLDDPDVEGIVFHARDLTERHEQDRRFRLLFEQAPIPAAMFHSRDGILGNHAFADLVGYTRDELRSVPIDRIVDAGDLRRGQAQLDALLRHDIEGYTVEQRWIRKDGSRFWGRTTVRLLVDLEGRTEGAFAAVQDVTNERAMLEALTDSERRFRAIVDNSTDIIAVLEPDGNWTASDAGTRQLGYPKGFDPDGGVFSLVHPDELGMAAEALAEVLDGRRGPMDPILLRLRDVHGDYHHYECVGQNLGNDADVGGVVITARNVDHRMELEDQIRREATHDALTGLLNRAAFMERLDQAIARRGRTGAILGLLFVDLDRFKQVNDTLGHAAGDTVLVAVARRIERCVRDIDTVARLGGDEFVVLCEDLDSIDRVDDIAERIVVAVEERVSIADREAFVGASVGVAFAQVGQTASDLMLDVDAALYRAKREGRSRVERFDDAMRADTAARVSLEIELRHALERDLIDVEYVPVVDVQTRVVEAFVARPRWAHGDAVLHGHDIRVLADDAGLGRALGRRLLDAVLRDRASWGSSASRPTGARLYLTPTTRHLSDRAFVDDVEAALRTHGVAPGDLCIGVPEEWLAETTGVAAYAMTRVHAIGAQIAVNGFGRAHASLVDLRSRAVDVVRLDPRFVFGLGVDPAGVAIVKGVIGLARALDLRVLADGVDEMEHLVALWNLGCDHATGTVLAEPVDAATAATLLDQPLPDAVVGHDR